MENKDYSWIDWFRGFEDGSGTQIWAMPSVYQFCNREEQMQRMRMQNERSKGRSKCTDLPTKKMEK